MTFAFEEAPLPEFVDALVLFLVAKSQGRYEIRSEYRSRTNDIIILEKRGAVIVECFLYNVICPDGIIEWCEPDMFDKVYASIEQKMASMANNMKKNGILI